MEKVEVNGPGTHPVYQFLKLGGVGFFASLFFSLEKKIPSSKLQDSIYKKNTLPETNVAPENRLPQ